ncbi:MAG TPA: hypothetical protein PK758_15155 [Tenuifilaceae bacterium]|nr:hypothetical protein [Tenuifilaceae bacterium]
MLQLSSIIRRVGFMLLLTLQLSAFSQSNYTFTPSTGTYSSITGTIVNLDGNYPTVNIGFTFNFNGVNYTQVIPSQWGWLSFRTGITVSEGDALKDGNLSGSLGRPLIGVLYAHNKTEPVINLGIWYQALLPTVFSPLNGTIGHGNGTQTTTSVFRLNYMRLRIKLNLFTILLTHISIGMTGFPLL